MFLKEHSKSIIFSVKNKNELDNVDLKCERKFFQPCVILHYDIFNVWLRNKFFAQFSFAAFQH